MDATAIKQLEYAARAAGYVPQGLTDDGLALLLDGLDRPWNPRDENPHSDSMGDALRLAVKLWISPMRYESVIFAGVGGSMQPSVEVSYTDDPKKATRLAITSVAAEVGRNMK